MGALFVDQVRVEGVVSALRAASAADAPGVVAVGGLDARGGAGEEAIAALCAAVGDVVDAFGVQVGFIAAAAEGIATRTASADRFGPS